ncbi:hypothetical protein LshimejAT787_2200040 [Lyophyllum shimeji]|uniref:Uncharacterized protein n=1 Tax=Lyophyllum shimeji TaxID=47721 RepID=A0A9P3UWQ3_LYOSH|nr:hypothetical protein LshimejAT787_2200040 [Lyophyllum shimeji]
MSAHGSSNVTMFTLPEDQRLRGYENYASWVITMELYGKPKGLLKYWENKIVVPPVPKDDSDGADAGTNPLPFPIMTSAESTTPTPLHSETPLRLEYELHESVALSSILINVVDIAGAGLNHKGKSYEA